MNKKCVLVVGGSGSVGKITVDFFNNNNWEVVQTSSQNKKGNIPIINFSDLESIKKFCRNNSKLYDAIVIASGKEPQYNLDEMDVEHFDKMMDIHLKGPIFLIKNIKNKIRENGSVILVSSVAANLGSYDPLYSTFKGGVNSMVKTLAREFKGKIRVNAISPSLIADSTVYHRMTEDFRLKHQNSTLSKRLLQPGEVAGAIFFLVENEHINGQIIHINGGQYFGN